MATRVSIISKVQPHWRLITVVILVTLAVWSRLLPHPPNFTPIAATALLAGSVLPRRLALSVVLTSMVISDLIIGLHPLILFTWGSYVITALLAHKFLRSKFTLGRLGGMTLIGSLIFFVVSNFGVWLEGGLYPRTGAGLVECFIQALPFFRNTLLGDAFYSFTLFGMYAVISHIIMQRHSSPSSLLR